MRTKQNEINRAPRVRALLCTACACAALVTTTAAQQVYVDAEPNDTPDTAAEFSAPATLMGAMPGGDQDAWLWTVSDEDATRRWTLELQGLPGLLTVADIGPLKFDETAQVTGFERLLKISSRDGAQPAVADSLLIEPGEYLIGLARSGGNARFRPAADSLSFGESNDESGAESTEAPDADPLAYRLIFRESGRLPTSSSERNVSRESAARVEPGREFAAFIESDGSAWYRIDIDETQAALRWDIDVQVPVGRRINAILSDADGTKLTDARNGQDGRLTLRDINRPAGSYYVEMRPALGRDEPAGFLQLLTLTEVGQRVDGDESEPNNQWSLANRADSAECCNGVIGERRDIDVFAYTLDESESLRSLSLQTPSTQTMTLCLLDNKGSSIQCRDGSGSINLPGLLLPAGEYGVSVSSGEIGANYTIAFAEESPPQPGREVEPNDSLRRAIGAPDNNRIQGSFDSDEDVDYFRFTITDEPQLWRVQAIGDAIGKLTYHDVTGTQQQSIAAAKGQRRIRLDNLFLFPGTHIFSIAGSDAGDYTLLARSLGPPNPDSELEPNDDESRRMPLRIGQTRSGLLSDPGDVDQYRFHLAGWDHIRLTATPPADGTLTAKLYFNRDVMGTAARSDGPIAIEGVFPPGDYQLVLAPREPSEAEYTLSLERLDRFQCAQDCEPNNNPVFAKPIPAGRIVEGVVGEWGDGDWFKLPVLDADQPARFIVESESRLGVRLYDHRVNRLTLDEDRTTSTYAGTLPAGKANYLHIESARPRPYTLTMLLGEETGPPITVTELDASAVLRFAADTVAAYSRFGQRVDGELALTNNGSEALEFQIDASVSDMAWEVELDRDKITLPPGATESIGLTAIAPVDARADKPVRVALRAQAGVSRFISVHADIAVDAGANPVSPVQSFNIPVSLQGGLDVAHLRYGASLSAVPEPRGDTEGQLRALIDGQSAQGYGASFDVRRDKPLELTIDLAGAEPVPVAGFALNPLARISVNFAPAEVALQLSTDGITFATVATASVVPVGTDQYVTLDTPVPATHARLLLEGAWVGEIGRRLTLGEVKVIAEPGHAPEGVGELNIADPDNGGHVVWSSPQIGARWDRAILTSDEDASYYRVMAEQRPEWVIGFHNNRAAAIERITWRETDDNNTKLTDLTVSVSLESPIGPWRTIAEWNRAASGDELVLESPGWARFVRFSAPALPEDEVVDPPELIAIYERATGESYRSVVSEWGFRSQTGWYEFTQPAPDTSMYAERENRTKDSADALKSGVSEEGSVQLGQVSHWYRPVLPDGHNALRIELTGDPTVRTELSLTDTAGEPIVLRKLPYESTPQRYVYDAYLEEGRVPVLEVREPPRNVLFLWDTSGSVDEFRPMIVNSVATYAEDLVPGRDMANLQPFGSGGPILDEWFGEPYLMQMVLNDFRSFSDNSAAENNQRIAAVNLANRPGTKAIVMVTDAETPREPRVWDEFKRVQPRVFTLNVGEQELSQDLMQDWASVNDGHYAFIQEEGDMEIAFERVAAMLRTPASYKVSMTTEARDAPGPGYLRVVSGDDAPARGAVELILDASGSMLQRMEGRRRIEIAKEVLTTAIREQIPAGTPTALRVFGHRTPNACETDLEIPLAPLETDVAIKRIDSIQAKNLARTPIADSLAAVKQDLKDASGPALIVLVTDGEETCDGDPAAVIATLRASGIEVSLNIVGFAIEDQALADEFAAWAVAGGGDYIAANDAEGLSAAVALSLSRSYTLFDADGVAVAKGQVDGDAVELDEGTYRLVVTGESKRVFDTVTIVGDSATNLEL